MKTTKTKKPLRFATLTAASLLAAALFFQAGSAEPGDGGGMPGYRIADDFSDIDREAWKSLPYQIRVPVYKTFSKERKQVFWRLKFEELKSLEWSEAELRHIRSLYSVICENPDLMEQGNDPGEDEDRFAIFLYNWKEEARDVLGWTRGQIHAVSGTGDQVLNTGGELKVFAPLTVGVGFTNVLRSIQSEICDNCPADGSLAFFPHPGSCTYFFVCAWGQATLRQCPNGLAFDSFIDACNWPQFVSGCE